VTAARWLRGLLLLLAVLVLAAGRAAASAPPARGFLGEVLAEAATRLDRAAAERPPVLRPPTPIKVRWRARRLTSIDLGAPLIDLAAGDLDGDGRAELVALTTRDVVVLGVRGRRDLAEIARAPLPAELPPVQPRDPVGAVEIVRPPGGVVEIRARASTAGRGARYALVGGELREVGAIAGFPACGDRTADLVPGRDYFGGDGPARVYAVRCRDRLVDAIGRPLTAEGTLGPGGALDLRVAVRCPPGDAACPAERHLAVPGVGIAFAIADVDRDGRPEVIASGDGAPGDRDQVAVYELPAAGAAVGKPVYQRHFTGGVTGLIAADLDGDGDLEVVAAVRLSGAARVDLWLLD
jgi:FG-GAP-like repeat